jgi:hypothetical protein
MKNILMWATIILGLIGITIAFRYLIELYPIVFWIGCVIIMVIYPFSLYYPRDRRNKRQ